MDYTTLTKKEVKKLQELSEALQDRIAPVVHITKPDGEKYDIVYPKKYCGFWEDLDKDFSFKEKKSFVGKILGFQIGLPWYKDSRYEKIGWNNPCPFSKIEPSMIDFVLEQRRCQIDNNKRNLIVSGIIGFFASGLLELILMLAQIINNT
nr:MAG TPA: hypothetical protein [Caudoviricetes sp.]